MKSEMQVAKEGPRDAPGRRNESEEPRVTDDPAARTLPKEAHGRMYKWPVGFGGYHAMLEVNDDGKILRGAATVAPNRESIVSLDGDVMLEGWVRERLWTQAMHLAWVSFEQGDGRYVLTLGEDPDARNPHPRGPRVILHGGPMASWYRIKDERYTQISRHPSGMEWRINTIERYDRSPDGRLIAAHYVMAYFNHHGGLSGLESFVNEFIDTQRVLLPSRRIISYAESGMMKTRVIDLSAHRVLA